MPWTFYLLIGMALALVVFLFTYKGPAARVRTCGVCGGRIKRKRFRWTMPSGETITTCANCTRALEAKQSREAVAEFLGDRKP